MAILVTGKESDLDQRAIRVAAALSAMQGSDDVCNLVDTIVCVHEHEGCLVVVYNSDARKRHPQVTETGGEWGRGVGDMKKLVQTLWEFEGEEQIVFVDIWEQV